MTRLLMLLVVVLLASTVAVAQNAATPAPASQAETASPAETAPPSPAGFTYEAAGRRDPFVSLMRRGAETAPTAVNRASGIVGLGAAEVSLRGVMASRGEFVGIVHGSDNKTYIVRAGQRLADGTIRRIERDAMVIVQQLNDPLAAERQRELRKALREDEAR